MSMGSASFRLPIVIRVPGEKASVLSAKDSIDSNTFSYSVLRLLNIETLCSPVLDACAYSFQYSKHRHTAQGRNTARGVPAFSDRLFGKRKPRNLPLKLPSAAGIIFHSTNALPKARQASSAASSGVSVQITLSQTRFTPALSQSLSQVRIHSPSPQP